MPKFTETMKREISLAESHYSNGIANQGKEIIEVAQARCLIYLIELLTSMREHLRGIDASLQAGIDTRIEGISYPDEPSSPEPLRKVHF